MSTRSPSSYGPVIEEALTQTADWSEPSAKVRAAASSLPSVESAFAHTTVRDPAFAEACLAGLLLRLGRWNRAHSLAQSRDHREFHYWHGFAHRLERDPGNANYWMARVGPHPLHEKLGQQAAVLGAMHPFDEWKHWQPEVFNDLFIEAVGTGSDLEIATRRIHEAEWEALFDFCYRHAVGAGQGGGRSEE